MLGYTETELETYFHDEMVALAQIRERNYAEPLRCHNLPIYAIGLAFDPQTHRLLDGAAEAL